MRPSPRSDEELATWAAAIIRREQISGTHGKVVIHLEAGRIVRVITEKSEVPEK